MVEIFKMRARGGKYRLCAGAEAAVRELIRQENDSAIAFGNARGVRNVFEDILVCQANRLAACETLSAEDLTGISRADVLAAADAAGIVLEEPSHSPENTPEV